jgi:hypothetical protein
MTSFGHISSSLWVTMTKVCPSSSRNLKRADANFHDAVSDFLMVHLQNDLLISARATATRCCSPPESSLGL